jgi:hypothetical protein
MGGIGKIVNNKKHGYERNIFADHVLGISGDALVQPAKANGDFYSLTSLTQSTFALEFTFGDHNHNVLKLLPSNCNPSG